MSVPTVEREVGPGGAAPPGSDQGGGSDPDHTTAPEAGVLVSVQPREAKEASASVPLTCATAFLATSASAWMTAGLFNAASARVVAVVGSLLGSALVAVSYRSRRPSLVQYLVLPVGVALGALLVLPDASGGTSSLPSLVREALQQGGLGQPPVPFDPGWRFLLGLFTVVLAAGAAAVSTGLERPRLALLVPLPVLFVAAVVQPSATAVVSSVVGLMLLVGALSVSYGVELAREGATSGRFEGRRLLRGAGAMLALVAILVATSRAGFLFPERDDEVVIPPQRPRTQATRAEGVIFTVQSQRQLPWRLGVLDVYDGAAWLTAPFRSGRLIEPSGDGSVPAVGLGESSVPVTFHLTDLPGHVVPAPPRPLRVVTSGFDITYDPRTQALRLPDKRAAEGMTYTVEAAVPPGAPELADATVSPTEMDEFLAAPPPPPEVTALLADAPPEPAYARLQYVRQAFYRTVVASGAGNPTDLPPKRVVELLEGKEGTPFEIAAAEALLARWAGVPARVGFGYFGGEPAAAETDLLQVRPKHGATWLEVHFEGQGWVPIIGTPPRAKASLDDGVKNADPAIRPSDELAVVVYVPVTAPTLRQTYLVARYWVLVTLPYVVALALVAFFYPGALKVARRYRRRRWAARRGPEVRIATAYAELRDAATDLNIGNPALSPLAFVHCVAEDSEHAELAWLVTRAVWGDLTRDLRPDDVDACEEMARSVRRRLSAATPAVNRVLAFAARASLRHPYSEDLPNLWPRHEGSVPLTSRFRRAIRRQPRRLRWRPAVALCSVTVVAILTAVGLRDGNSAADRGAGAGLAGVVVPEQVGGFRLIREQGAESAYRKAAPTSLISEGRVFSIHDGDTVQGSLQIGAFKTGIDASMTEVHEGVRRSIATGRFERERIGSEPAWVLQLPEQRLLLWFSPDGRTFHLLVSRRAFEAADTLFEEVIARHRGEDPSSPARPLGPPPLDSRRGTPI